MPMSAEAIAHTSRIGSIQHVTVLSKNPGMQHMSLRLSASGAGVGVP